VKQRKLSKKNVTFEQIGGYIYKFCGNKGDYALLA